jgi:hypothetical protein
MVRDSASEPELGLPGQIFGQDFSRERLKIGPPAGCRPAGGPTFRFSNVESGRHPDRKSDSGTLGFVSQEPRQELDPWSGPPGGKPVASSIMRLICLTV